MIADIKNQQAEDVLLSIFNVHFEAVEEDITKAFSEFTFSKIINYRKGAFALYFFEKSRRN